jgi:hypothetical protein
MLRKNENGEIEVFYVDSFEEKQLHDTRRKKYRRLEMEIPDRNKKQALQQRQKLARELREIKKKLQGGNHETN